MIVLISHIIYITYESLDIWYQLERCSFPAIMIQYLVFTYIWISRDLVNSIEELACYQRVVTWKITQNQAEFSLFHVSHGYITNLGPISNLSARISETNVFFVENLSPHNSFISNVIRVNKYNILLLMSVGDQNIIYLCTLLCVYILILLSCFGCSQYLLLLSIIPSSFYANHII